MGVGGRGLAPLAGAASFLGAEVSGCDTGGFRYARDLVNEAGIAIQVGHDPAHLDDGSRLVVTASARADNDEVVAALKKGRLHRRMDLVAGIMAERPGLGVCGSHGKGTVTALAAGAALEYGLDPLIVVGADAPDLGGALRLGSGPSVMEVDDSDLAAHFVACDIAVVTNLDDDHPHLPTTLTEATASVGGFVSNARELVILGPSPRQEDLAAQARAPVWRVGRELKAAIAQESPEGSLVRITGPEGERVEALIRLVGGATATNAAIAYGAARAMGVPREEAASGLSLITRLHRRLEPLGCHDGVWVYDDFGGKHPVNVAAGIAALRRRHPSARIVAIFEPVLASRIQKWGWRYSRALATADAVIILPTYQHPEYPAKKASDRPDWYSGAGGIVISSASITEAAERAASLAKPGDIIVGFLQIHQHGVELGQAVIEAIGSA